MEKTGTVRTRSAMKLQGGFTIVELLIVVVVIAILATITIVAFNGITQRAHTSQRADIARALSKAIENYYTLNDSYPPVDKMTCTLNDQTQGNSFIANELNIPSMDSFTRNCGAIYNNHKGMRCTYFHPTNAEPYFSGYSINGSVKNSAFNYCSNKKTASYDSEINIQTHNCYSSDNVQCIGYVLVFFTGSNDITCASVGLKPALGMPTVCAISNVHGTYDL